MALSIDNLPEGGGLNKIIQPGNVTAKINSIELEDFRFIEGAYHIVMNLETEPIPGFEGFAKDPKDPSKGNYDGQIAKVKASQYAFADGTTKTGIKVERDRNILIFLKNLCNALGCEEWFKAQNNKHETIESFVAAFQDDAPFKDIYLDWCISGKEYMNKQGYTAHNLYLPKSSKGAYAFSAKDSGKTLPYNETIHLIKLDTSAVKQFDSLEDDEDDSSEDLDFSKAGEDFDLD
jgi:hypothetical protein